MLAKGIEGGCRLSVAYHQAQRDHVLKVQGLRLGKLLKCLELGEAQAMVAPHSQAARGRRRVHSKGLRDGLRAYQMLEAGGGHQLRGQVREAREVEARHVGQG